MQQSVVSTAAKNTGHAVSRDVIERFTNFLIVSWDVLLVVTV